GTLLYGALSYAIFFATFLYTIGFITGFIVPKNMLETRDDGLLAALAINSGLIALFALQHSAMARPAFKRWITRFIPRSVERSTYVLASSVALIALLALWQPLGGLLWAAESNVVITVLRVLQFAGFGIVLYSSFLIDHFDLFGLRQVFLEWRGVEYTDHPFRVPALYRFVRHPLYVGWILGMCATPVLTGSHLFFAATLTAYILGATILEERDLVRHFGDTYRRYQKTTPMLLPRLRPAPLQPVTKDECELAA
ncbi:MAG: methanethiol S-methyltransferase, partial [Planctomycetota bacterium]